MSGGFFRGTSADQDTRFSNKAAKLLKTQKFAPELDQLVDMTKVNMDVMRPWIATRVTQLLGFEDEVLINFIYELLEGKKGNVDGKQVQIQITGFMEKNTGKFMRELWSLLTSAQNNISKIPQQFLDEKAEETRLKKAEEQRVISEVRRKEEEKKEAEQQRANNNGVSLEKTDGLESARPNGSPKGKGSPDDACDHAENGINKPRSPRSRTRSRSHSSSKSASRSPRRNSRRRASRSLSRSPPRRRGRSRSPIRRRGRSRSPPPRRAHSPINVRQRDSRSPRRARSPYARSPRRYRRSPVHARSPRGRRSPPLSRSPRGRSPIITRSPRRHNMSNYSRSSPRRRKSPPRSTPPRYRRRSPPHNAHASPHRYSPAHPRRRQIAASPQGYNDGSPRRRPPSTRRGSPSPQRVHSPSNEGRSVSPSPPLSHKSGSPHQAYPSPRGKISKRLSPVHVRNQCSSSPSPIKPPVMGQKARSPYSPHISDASPVLDRSRSPSASVETDIVKSRAEHDTKNESQKISGRTRSALSPSRENLVLAENLEIAAPASGSHSPISAKKIRREERDQSVSKSSDDDHQRSPIRKSKQVESDGNLEHHGPTDVHDKKAAKKRHREEKKMRKKEKRRKREERHRRKEEKRSSKVSCNEIAFVAPPPSSDKQNRTEEFDSASEGLAVEDEEQQRIIEDELRRKALDSLRAKKVISS